MSTLTAAQAYVAGLRDVEGENQTDKNRIRIRSFLNFLYFQARDLDEEMVRDIAVHLFNHYSNGNDGSFWLARIFREESEKEPAKNNTLKQWRLVALIELSALMCRNMESAHQCGHIAGGSMEIAFWVFREIKYTDRVAASRLLRTCGKCLTGPFIDDFFWTLSTSSDVNLQMASKTLAEGMLAGEGPGRILAEYLKKNNRGPDESREKIETFKAAQERRRADQESFRQVRKQHSH